MSNNTARTVLAVAMVAFGLQYALGFPLWFQPSGAKGWPGVAFETVFAAFVSVMLFTSVVTCSIMTAAIYPFMAGPERSPRDRTLVFTGVLCLGIGIGATAAIALFLNEMSP